MRSLSVLLLLLPLGGAACGPVEEDDIFFGDAGPSTVDATTVFDGFAPFDAPQYDGPQGPPFNGGGDFLCNGCICDGTLHVCLNVLGGAQQAPILDAGLDDAEAGDEDADAGDASVSCDEVDGSACVAIPLSCLPKPTCECVLENIGPPCSCDVDKSGSGLVITCVYP